MNVEKRYQQATYRILNLSKALNFYRIPFASFLKTR